MVNRDQALYLNGFEDLTKALRRIEGGAANFGIEYELKRRLRVVGEGIAEVAPQFVTHATGRHGDPAQPRLEDSARVSVTQRQASVFSIAIHGGLQNFGGGPHAGWAARGPHVKRKNASRWMGKAVASRKEWAYDELEGLLDWLVDEFERD